MDDDENEIKYERLIKWNFEEPKWKQFQTLRAKCMLCSQTQKTRSLIKERYGITNT